MIPKSDIIRRLHRLGVAYRVEVAFVFFYYVNPSVWFPFHHRLNAQGDYEHFVVNLPFHRDKLLQMLYPLAEP